VQFVVVYIPDQASFSPLAFKMDADSCTDFTIRCNTFPAIWIISPVTVILTILTSFIGLGLQAIHALSITLSSTSEADQHKEEDEKIELHPERKLCL